MPNPTRNPATRARTADSRQPAGAPAAVTLRPAARAIDIQLRTAGPEARVTGARLVLTTVVRSPAWTL
ncbi:hypothetical protein [Longispora fulva]|uniref:Uncharacterized protein n=1 Tax=Longispora fulva TaxID=619741 RepID=A0A8J7GGZ6_9ACTN|nr:hypothetical protein [Longispora fulva]MBG6138834.1 hypothetical protein [Longispora fulva]